MKISIVTPWLNHSELCQVYERSCQGAEVVVVDNGSQPAHAEPIKAMVERMNGIYIRNEENCLFAPANNQGLEASTGDIVMFMNNDVDCPPGWLVKVERDVGPKSLYGPSRMVRRIAGKNLPYIAGWCIAARREVWEDLGGWNTLDYEGMYWEDNDLCLRAILKGYGLIETSWNIWHFNNYTSRKTPGSYNYSERNQALFEQKVREANIP